jgi:hypothetical protein
MSTIGLGGALLTGWSDWNPSLDEASKKLKGRSLHKWIIKNLDKRVVKRFSTFEIDEHICYAFDYLIRSGKIILDQEEEESYPYSSYKIRGSK